MTKEERVQIKSIIESEPVKLTQKVKELVLHRNAYPNNP